MRKKQSEGETRWEVGESEEERMGEGEGEGTGGMMLRLSSSAGVKRAPAKNIAVARFRHKRY